PLDELRQRLLAPRPEASVARAPRAPARPRPARRISAVKPLVVHAGRNYTFVKVETEDGLYGLGEAGLGRRARALEETLKAMAPDLVGEDPFRTEHLWQVLYRGGFFPGGVVQAAAVSALDMALWDLRGKALGVPVYELLGGRTRDRVACYPHVGEREDVDRLVAACRQKVDEGWRFVRWGLCDPAGPDRLEPARAVRFGIEQVRAVRQALPDVEICVDVHTRLDPPAAIQFCQGVQECRPFFVEDPLRSENPASLRTLRQQTSVPIAVGEQFAGKWAFRECLEQDLMDYCRMDLCIVGGITEARKIAGWCETHYIHLAPHNPLGPVCTAASLHLCLASSLVGVMELARVPGTILPEVFPVQVPFADGHLLVPEAPGLGVEIDETAAAARPYQETAGRSVGYRRDDGSYTNW
ncbi:MAG: mandelate racemase/muconate lactonizing enzyme family protein, partial [Gemmatimonadota bacterium]